MYLGIEIGGTKLQLGLGPGDGTLAALWRRMVDVAAGPEGIRRQIMAAVPELLAKGEMDRSQIDGVGIGFGGPVDDATHTIIKSHQIEGWDDFPLADWITDLLDLPVVLGNDSDVAGLAEALFGAGKGLSPIFYMNIGSGIGGGFIINGEVYRGSGRGAAEIGHLALDGIYFGHSGSAIHTTAKVEDCASGWAIAREARERLKRREGRDSLLSGAVRKKKGPITAHDVGQAAEQGDPFAKEVIRLACLYLAQAICHVITLLCPRRIIVGGGVSLMGEKVLFSPLRELVAENVFQPFANCYDIVPAALAEEVVVHGALALARRRFSR
jgi:glucokinase